MTEEPAILQIAANGRVRSLNKAARTLLGNCAGRSCAATVMAKETDGTSVCQSGCATSKGTGERDCKRSNGVLVRGERHRVTCSPTGDGTVVILEPCADVDAWTEKPTARECEVLHWIARGETDKDIAVRFGVKTSTVRTHTERARKKLRASTRAQAVARAMSLGLI